mgnify:CR=1 FL=1
MSSVLCKFRKVLGVMIFPAICLLAVSCGSDDSVTGPEAGPDTEPEVEIKTPTSLTITYISARAFPNKKPNGDTWDWNPVSILDEYPDDYVSIAKEGELSSYRSETVDDQQSTDRPNLSTADDNSPHKLPLRLSYNQSYTFVLADDDGVSADDAMGQKTWKPKDYYLDDNATSFSRTLECSNGVKIEVRGTWQY